MMIIIGAAVGGGCVLLICVVTLVSLCCRHTGKGEVEGQIWAILGLGYILCQLTLFKAMN